MFADGAVRRTFRADGSESASLARVTLTAYGCGLATARGESTRNRFSRSAIALLGIVYAIVGVQAAFFPQSFFDDFPVGRGWVAATDAVYSEHLVRDVGALFLALVIVSIWAWWEPALCLPVAVAWLVQGALHALYHAGHLDHLDTGDAVAMMMSLVAVPVIAIAVIVSELRHSNARA
jgi:hypothetical protein